MIFFSLMRPKITILEVQIEAGELDFWRDIGAIQHPEDANPGKVCKHLEDTVTSFDDEEEGHGRSTSSLGKCVGHARLG